MKNKISLVGQITLIGSLVLLGALGCSKSDDKKSGGDVVSPPPSESKPTDVLPEGLSLLENQTSTSTVDTPLVIKENGDLIVTRVHNRSSQKRTVISVYDANLKEKQKIELEGAYYRSELLDSKRILFISDSRYAFYKRTETTGDYELSALLNFSFAVGKNALLKSEANILVQDLSGLLSLVSKDGQIRATLPRQNPSPTLNSDGSLLSISPSSIPDGDREISYISWSGQPAFRGMRFFKDNLDASTKRASLRIYPQLKSGLVPIAASMWGSQVTYLGLLDLRRVFETSLEETQPSLIRIEGSINDLFDLTKRPEEAILQLADGNLVIQGRNKKGSALFFVDAKTRRIIKTYQSTSVSETKDAPFIALKALQNNQVIALNTREWVVFNSKGEIVRSIDFDSRQNLNSQSGLPASVLQFDNGKVFVVLSPKEFSATAFLFDIKDGSLKPVKTIDVTFIDEMRAWKVHNDTMLLTNLKGLIVMVKSDGRIAEVQLPKGALQGGKIEMMDQNRITFTANDQVHLLEIKEELFK